MKISVAILIFFIVENTQGQSFEGSIKWTTNTEMVDTDNHKQISKVDASVKIKKGNAAMIVTGADMDGVELLYLKDKDQVIALNRKEKQYIVLAPMEDEGTAPRAEVTKTTETQQILGHTCTKYISKKSVSSLTFISNYWVATTVNDINYSTISKLSNGGESAFPPEIEKEGGMPLKIENLTMRDKTLESKSVMEITSIIKQIQNDSDFIIPKGFTETKM